MYVSIYHWYAKGCHFLWKVYERRAFSVKHGTCKRKGINLSLNLLLSMELTLLRTSLEKDANKAIAASLSVTRAE